MIVIIVSSSQTSAALNSLISKDGQAKSELVFANPSAFRSIQQISHDGPRIGDSFTAQIKDVLWESYGKNGTSQTG